MNGLTLKELTNNLTSEKIIKLVMDLGSDDYQDKGDYIIFKTICHNIDAEDASMKLYYYKKDHRFMCYTQCGCSFNIFSLFERRYQLLGIDYNFYQDIVLKIAEGVSLAKKENNFYHKYESIYDNLTSNNPNVNLTIYPKSYLNAYIYATPQEWLDDGINEEMIKLYNIKYSIEQNKIIIPHYDINNNLIGIRGRALNEEDILIGKYLPIMIEGKLCSHPLMYNLYGLNIVKDNIKKIKTAIVSEGEKGALQYGTMFGRDKNICVACCGSSFHKYQLDLLLAAGAERVIIAFDKEGRDNKEKEKYFNKLYGICSKYKSYCKMGFLYDSSDLLNLKESPFDRGKETFLKLMKKGVWL